MRFIRPSASESMERLVELYRGLAPTYTEIGATLAGQTPPGLRSARGETQLGHGSATFSHAVAGLQRWAAHRHGGVDVFPPEVPIRTGETVIVTVGPPFLALVAPCRIVGVLDAPGKWGFAYGTLPGHPEQGEESFVVTMAADGSVRFAITSLSRPGDPLVRLAGPLARGIQACATKGYLRSLRRYVDRQH
jgi:uncharacterized protein (UPF0548 family)